MKKTKTLAVISISLLAACFLQTSTHADGQFRGRISPFFERHDRSGIIGQVVMATWAPSEETPVSCMVRITTSTGTVVADVRTTKDGWFIVALIPGTYLLTPHYPPAPGGVLICPTTTVTVTKRDFVAVELPFSFGPE
jgi:hypothetical protein